MKRFLFLFGGACCSAYAWAGADAFPLKSVSADAIVVPSKDVDGIQTNGASSAATSAIAPADVSSDQKQASASNVPVNAPVRTPQKLRKEVAEQDGYKTLSSAQLKPLPVPEETLEEALAARSAALAALNFLTKGAWRLRHFTIEMDQETSVSKAFILSHIGFKENEIIQLRMLYDAARSLYKTNWIDGLQWIPTNIGADAFDLCLKLKISPKISRFKFTGNHEFGDKTLIYEMKSRIHEARNKQRLQADIVRLKNFYISKGCFKVRIGIESYPTTEGYEEVHIDIDEGQRYKVRRIDFVGVTAFKPGELRDLLATKKWWILSWLYKTGRLDEERLAHDIQVLRKHYWDAGYLDVDIDRDSVVLQEKGNRLRVVFVIDEGMRYYLGNVSVHSDIVEDDDVLLERIQLKPGDVASVKAIDAACEAIRDFYGRNGYVDANVQVNRTLVDDEIDLDFKVTRGLQYRIHSIYLSGNVLSQARVILREMALAPGDILDRRRMQLAEMRLQNTGLFKTAFIVPENSPAPLQKDLKVSVEEAKTGSIKLMGSISKEQGFAITLGLGQGNFDYNDPQSKYRGAGQKGLAEITLGKYSQGINIGYQEPWLFDRELRWGFDVFASQTNLNGASYKQQRVGTEVYIGKRLFEFVEGRLYYHIEYFRLAGVDKADVSQVVKDERRSRIISKVGFSMDRDTRDRLLYPTEGNVIGWDNQVAGLGGHVRYFRSTLGGAQYFLVSPNHEQVFMIRGKAAMVRALGGKDLSLFDREFLGGTSDLRGFEYQEAGPKTDDIHTEPLGGQYSLAIMSEYSMKLHSRLHLIGFLDVGEVFKMNDAATKKYLMDGSDTWYGDIGFGISIDIVNVPLKLWFAYPFKTDNYLEKKFPFFAYSFGMAF